MESIKNDEKYLANIPYAEMAKRNWDWIEKTKDPFEKVIMKTFHLNHYTVG